MKADDCYGDRSDRHWAIMLMSEEDLHEEHPWTAALAFHETMKKGEFKESQVPDESVFFGTKPDGKTHKFVVGNEQGEILPKFLFAKLKAIESGTVFGKPLTITVAEEQRDRLYAMAREAQLREIVPFKLKAEKQTSTTSSSKSQAKSGKQKENSDNTTKKRRKVGRE